MLFLWCWYISGILADVHGCAMFPDQEVLLNSAGHYPQRNMYQKESDALHLRDVNPMHCSIHMPFPAVVWDMMLDGDQLNFTHDLGMQFFGEVGPCLRSHRRPLCSSSCHPTLSRSLKIGVTFRFARIPQTS